MGNKTMNTKTTATGRNVHGTKVTVRSGMRVTWERYVEMEEGGYASSRVVATVYAVTAVKGVATAWVVVPSSYTVNAGHYAPAALEAVPCRMIVPVAARCHFATYLRAAP